MTPQEAIEYYRRLANPYPNMQPDYVAQQRLAAAPSPVQSVIQAAAPALVREGIKSAIGSGSAAASEGLSASAIDSLLSSGSTELMTPLTPSTFSSSAASTLAPEVGTAATDITNFAGTATPYLGAAGTAAGAYGAYQGIKDKNPLTAGIGGLGAGLGLNAMGFALGPYGWAAMIAAPAVAALVNKMGDKDRWQTESKRLKKLQKGGAFVPDALLASMPKAGRSKDQLINKAFAADYIGRDLQNNWINNKFAQSRSEADLRPEDIVGYSAFAEKNKDWFNLPLEERLKQAGDALAANAVRERRGTIDIDWNKVAGALNASK